FEGRVLPPLPEELVNAMIKAGGGSLALRVRQKDPAAVEDALRAVADAKTPLLERLRLIAVFGEVPQPAAADVLENLIRAGEPRVRSAALAAAAAYDDPRLVREIVSVYPELSPEDRDVAQSVLSTRASSAAMLLEAVETGRIAK